MAEETEGTTAQGQEAPRTFTQEEVDAIVGKAKARYKGYAELKAKAEEYDGLSSKYESAQAELEELRRERDGLAAERDRRAAVARAAKEHGVDAELLAMMAGDGEEAIEANAEALAAKLAAIPGYPSVGDNGGKGAAPTTRDDIEKIRDPAARVRARAAHAGLYRKG